MTTLRILIIAILSAIALQGQTSIHAPEESPVSALKTPADSADVTEELLSDASAPKDTASDSAGFRERPMEPMSPLGLTIGKAGEDVYIASDGVGIGTTSPDQRLQVVGHVMIGETDETGGRLYLYGTTAGKYSEIYTSNGNLHIDAGYGEGGSNRIYLNYYAGSGADIRLGTGDNKQNVYFNTGGIWNASGNVGIGTEVPSAKISISTTGAELGGTAMSPVFKSNAGALGTTQGDQLPLASVGFKSNNNSALGIRAIRAQNGSDWTTTAIGFTMDVDNTPIAGGGYLVLNASGNIGIGIANPLAELDINGQIRIRGGTPGLGKVLTSDANGLANWENPSGGGLDISSIDQGHHIYKGAGDSDIEQSVIYEEGGQIAIGDNEIPAGFVTASVVNQYTANLAPFQLLSYYGGTSTPTGQILSKIARGTKASPSALLADDIMVGFAARGHDGTNWSSAQITMLGKAEENWEPGKYGTYWAFGTTESGTAIRNEKMRITGSGNVGIGTSSPSARMHIISPNLETDEVTMRMSPLGGGSSTVSRPSILDFWSTFDNYGADQLSRRTASIRVGFNSGAWGNEYMSFHVGRDGWGNDGAVLPNERMRIAGSGNVGIGTDSPIANLHVTNHSGAQVTEILESYSTTSAQLKFRRAGGTVLLPEPLDSGVIISNIGSAGWNGVSFANSANIRVLADEDLTSTAYGTRMDFRVTKRGTSSLIYPLTLTSDERVGIFNQEPEKVLDVYSNNTSDYISLSVAGDATTGIDATGILLLERRDNAMGYIGFRNNHTLSNQDMVLSVRTGASAPFTWHPFLRYIVDDGYLLLNEDGGNVGIGTTSPGAKLEVAGQVKITGGTPGAGKVLTSDADGLATWETVTGSGSDYPDNDEPYVTAALGAIQPRVAMYNGTVEYGTIENNTIIYRNGVEVVNAPTPTTGTFSVSQGDILITNSKPAGMIDNSQGLSIPPISSAGTEHVFYSVRFVEHTVYIYSPYSVAKVDYYLDGYETGTPTQTITINPGTVGTLTLPTADGTTCVHRFYSSAPVIMAKLSAGDHIFVPPASKEVIHTLSGARYTMESASVSSYNNIRYTSDSRLGSMKIADGAGQDADLGLPYRMLGDTYIITHAIADFAIASVEPNVISVYYYSGGSFVLYDEYDHTAASRSNPVKTEVGVQSGAGPIIISSAPILITGQKPFYLRTNDPGNQDEYAVIGYRQSLRDYITGGGGDNWGSQVVETDASLSGDGTSAGPLKTTNGNQKSSSTTYKLHRPYHGW